MGTAFLYGNGGSGGSGTEIKSGTFTINGWEIPTYARTISITGLGFEPTHIFCFINNATLNSTLSARRALSLIKTPDFGPLATMGHYANENGYGYISNRITITTNSDGFKIKEYKAGSNYGSYDLLGGGTWSYFAWK